MSMAGLKAEVRKRREVTRLGQVKGYAVYGRDDGSVFAKATDKPQRVDDGWEVLRLSNNNGINLPKLSYLNLEDADTGPPDEPISITEVHIPVKQKFIKAAPDQTIIVRGGCLVHEGWKVWCIQPLEFWRFKYSSLRPYQRVGFWEQEA